MTEKQQAAGERCPACGADGGVAVVYGFPGVDLFAAAARGEVALGGCVVSGEDPTRTCPACGNQWRS